MTEKLAEAALRAVAAEMGPGWHVGPGWPAVGKARLEITLRYGELISFCRGRTWAKAVDNFVKGCRLGGILADCVPERYMVGSAEELVLKLFVDGLLQETPGKTML